MTAPASAKGGGIMTAGTPTNGQVWTASVEDGVVTAGWADSSGGGGGGSLTTETIYTGSNTTTMNNAVKTLDTGKSFADYFQLTVFVGGSSADAASPAIDARALMAYSTDEAATFTYYRPSFSTHATADITLLTNTTFRIWARDSASDRIWAILGTKLG